MSPFMSSSRRDSCARSFTRRCATNTPAVCEPAWIPRLSEPVIEPLRSAYRQTKIFRNLEDNPFLAPPPRPWASWDDYWAFIARGGNVAIFSSPGAVPRGRKASMVFTRTGEDVATVGLHFVHTDGDGLTDFSDEDSATLEGALTDVWDALKTNHVATLALDRIIWHRFGVGVVRPNPFAREFLIPGGIPGTHVGDDPLPPQCACSVTFKTAARRNWGRIYWPPTAEGNVTDGRFAAGYIEEMRTVFGTLLDAVAAANLPLVVWSPRHEGKQLQFFKRDADHPESAHTLELDVPDSSSFARTVDQVQV